MSLNLESISVKMTDELDLAVAQKPVTGFMADNNLRGKFVGAKTVMSPAMTNPMTSHLPMSCIISTKA